MGRDRINHHVFTAGTFLAFIVAVFKLYDPVRKFAQFNNNFQQAVGASSEIFRFMDMEDEVREKPAAKRHGKVCAHHPVRGRVSLLLFQFNNGKRRIHRLCCMASIWK